jgi:hypothetical protein
MHRWSGIYALVTVLKVGIIWQRPVEQTAIHQVVQQESCSQISVQDLYDSIRPKSKIIKQVYRTSTAPKP